MLCNNKKVLLYGCKHDYDWIKDIDIHHISNHITDILWTSIQYDRLSLCKWLIRMCPSVKLNEFDNNPFFHNINYYKSIEMYEWLLINPSFNNFENIYYVFLKACTHGHLTLCKWMYNYNVDYQHLLFINLLNEDNTLIHICNPNNYKTFYYLFTIINTEYILENQSLLLSVAHWPDNNKTIQYMLKLYKDNNVTIDDHIYLQALHNMIQYGVTDICFQLCSLIKDQSLINYLELFGESHTSNICEKLYEYGFMTKNEILSFAKKNIYNIGTRNLVKSTINNTFYDNMDMKLFETFVAERRLKLCKWILENTNNVWKISDNIDILKEICKTGYTCKEMIEWFLENDTVDENIMNECFQYSCENFHDNIRGWFIIKGYTMSIENCQPVYLKSCRRGILNTIISLNSTILYENIYKCFYDATMNNKLNVVQWLYENYSCTHEYLSNPVFFDYSCVKGYIDMCMWIYEKHSNTNLRNGFKNCCKNNHLNIAKWIYRIKNSIMFNDNVFENIIVEKHYEMIMWLYPLNKKFEKHCEQLFIQSCFDNQLELCKMIYMINNDTIDIFYNNHHIFKSCCEKHYISMCKWLTSLFPHTYTLNIDIHGQISYNIFTNIETIMMENCDIECCSICYDNSEIITKCNHYYCGKCLGSWLSNNVYCPMCREHIKYDKCIRIKN
jgi:hypothetical protein